MENRPSRDELRQRLKAKTLQSKLGRTNLKIRNKKIEKFKEEAEKANVERENQRTAFLDAIKKMSPEELKKMGIDMDKLKDNLKTSVEDDDIEIPKMKPVN
jgi:hypothetical protein